MKDLKMEWVLETGPNHPGQKLYVQQRDGKSAFDMTADVNRAERYLTEKAATKAVAKFSTHYGLRPVRL